MLAAVAGCSSLPTIVPDMGMRPNRPVQLEGARGPLTAQQSKAILDRLKSGGKETGIFDRHLALAEAITGSPLMVGNQVVLLHEDKNFKCDTKSLIQVVFTLQEGTARVTG